MRYLLDTLAKRDLFSWLTLAPARWWHCLLYRDAYNWGGVEATLPPGLWEATEKAGVGGAPGMDEIDDVDPTQIGTPGGPKLRLVSFWGGYQGTGWHAKNALGEASSLLPYVEAVVALYVVALTPAHAIHARSCLWNLKEFLPPALQEHLVLLLAEFVYRPWKEAATAALKGATQGGSQAVADAAQAQDLQVGGRRVCDCALRANRVWLHLQVQPLHAVCQLASSYGHIAQKPCSQP